MRWIAIAAVFAVSSGVVAAADSLVAADHLVADVPASVVVTDAVVTVTAIPSHSMAAELVKELAPNPAARPAKKLKVAQKKPFPKSLLSRTERHQLALLVAKPKAKSGDSLLLDLLHEEDAGSSSEDIDLQRFFSRPKVAKVMDEDDSDEELSDAVKVRLFLARMQAVRAHERKFPEA